MKCTGEEAVGGRAGAGARPHDMCFPSYRQQGLLIARGYPLVDMMCQVYSNVRDPLKGRQLPIMYSSKAHGFFSISGNLGTQFSQAVGWAMASAYKGDDRIAATWIGDGTHRGRRFPPRAQFRLRLSRAGHPQCRQQSMGDLELSGHRRRRADDLRLARHRLRPSRPAGRRQRFPRCLCRDAMGRGTGPQQSRRHADRALHLSRGRPFHERRSSRYRPSDEPTKWPLGDPIARLKTHLIGLGAWTEADTSSSRELIVEEVRAANKEAESLARWARASRPAPEPCSRTSSTTCPGT